MRGDGDVYTQNLKKICIVSSDSNNFLKLKIIEGQKIGSSLKGKLCKLLNSAQITASIIYQVILSNY